MKIHVGHLGDGLAVDGDGVFFSAAKDLMIMMLLFCCLALQLLPYPLLLLHLLVLASVVILSMLSVILSKMVFCYFLPQIVRILF